MRLARTIGCLILLSGMVTGLSHAQIKGLGTIDFPTSGSPQARELFLQGALLLHSFEYDDAREAFQQAWKMDPDFGMAHWGEAMTHNRPLWVQLDAVQDLLQDVPFRQFLDGAVLQQVLNGVQLDALPQHGSLQFPLFQRFLIITHLYQSSLKSWGCSR